MASRHRPTRDRGSGHIRVVIGSEFHSKFQLLTVCVNGYRRGLEGMTFTGSSKRLAPGVGQNSPWSQVRLLAMLAIS